MVLLFVWLRWWSIWWMLVMRWWFFVWKVVWRSIWGYVWLVCWWCCCCFILSLNLFCFVWWCLMWLMCFNLIWFMLWIWWCWVLVVFGLWKIKVFFWLWVIIFICLSILSIMDWECWSYFCGRCLRLFIIRFCWICVFLLLWWRNLVIKVFSILICGSGVWIWSCFVLSCVVWSYVSGFLEVMMIVVCCCFMWVVFLWRSRLNGFVLCWRFFLMYGWFWLVMVFIVNNWRSILREL